MLKFRTTASRVFNSTRGSATHIRPMPQIIASGRGNGISIRKRPISTEAFMATGIIMCGLAGYSMYVRRQEHRLDKMTEEEVKILLSRRLANHNKIAEEALRKSFETTLNKKFPEVASNAGKREALWKNVSNLYLDHVHTTFLKEFETRILGNFTLFELKNMLQQHEAKSKITDGIMLGFCATKLSKNYNENSANVITAIVTHCDQLIEEQLPILVKIQVC